MKFIKTIVAVAVITTIAACQESNRGYKTAAQQSEAARQTSINNVMKAVTTPILEYSLDRENIAKRIERTNDENKIQWIYLIDTATVISRFAVRGKVTSGGKRLNKKYEWNKYSVNTGQYSSYSRFQDELPDEMGTYGSSNPYIFWFNLDDSLVQTNLEYIILDKPYNITSGKIQFSMVDDKELREKKAIEDALRKGKTLEQAKEGAKQ